MARGGCETRSRAEGSSCLGTMPLVASRKMMLGGNSQARLSFASTASKPRHWLWGWAAWITSVLVASTVLNTAGPLLAVFSSSSTMPATQVAAKVGHTLHRAAKRAGACAANGVIASEYNVPLHVGALLIILGVSSLACATPLLAARFPVLRIPEPFLFGVRHFGTGILLATAFVHLLPTAFTSLNNGCLSSFWTIEYPAMPGAIALFGIFFVAVIEMVFSPVRQFTPRPAAAATAAPRDEQLGDGSAGSKTQTNLTHVTAVPAGGGGLCVGHAGVVAAVARGQHPRAVESSSSSSSSSSSRDSSIAPAHHLNNEMGEESQSRGLTAEQQRKKSILQCMLLEVGILFHSVFIGMALSVAVGSNLVVLLIAIAFHQTFEGLALGARIASIAWPGKTLQPWLMVMAYGCTTPLGQAIGLATHSLYSPDSEFGLILVGTMNAVSSGLLVFAALIELLAEDFLSDHSWATLRGRRRVVACVLVLMGAICMSLVGAWA
ncbi:ZIP zinc transporter-domain-containing protein [Lasiosphaeria miniovina]|uniref:ZIP zinc transporter-domain-containing protein n=1 Tax=Lasiosphaeria miniovina TaxID=1954250 RepID=A0AA39ZUQ6_9PEZI|nr:ZIP zinc transporter-domain-containing protein [Lasiosphaeria miniovina]KAK0703901.1 ZIP zinc transporter-domain-containing protein [Lasiosphaeria miniovina]